jgi:hypothetical protein
MTSRQIHAGARAAALALAVAGCGGVSGIPIDQTATDIATTVCPKAWSCCTADQLSGNSAAGTSEADCEVQTKQSFVNQLSTLQRSVDQKRATYQSSKLDSCLATIKSSSCAALDVTNHLAGISGCATFTTPLVATGGACSQNYECVDGWCNVPMNSSNGDGVCAAFVGTGESCAAGGGVSCGPGAVCDIEGTVDDSSDDLCETVSDDGGACTDDLQCTSLNCSSSGGAGMTCAAPTSPPAPMCFYASGCSATGGRPGAGTLLLLAGFVLVAYLRAGRRRHPRR